jgi:hypothetical protein
MSVLKIQDINYNNLILAKSGKATKLLYDDTENKTKNNLKIFTPKLQVMFSKSVDKEWAKFSEFSIDCYIHDDDKISEFEEFDENLQNKIKSENKSLYGDLDYFPFLKPNKDYPKLIKMIFPRDSQGNFETVFFDKDKNKILLTESNILDLFSRGTVFKGVVECVKIWCFNNKFGTIWNLSQLRISTSPPPKIEEPETDLEPSQFYNQCQIE